MRSVSLNFKKNDLLSGEIPCVIASVSSSREALSITPGPSHSRLMTELNLHPEPSYELLYTDVNLEKSDSQRDGKVDHNLESYASFYEEICFQSVTSEAELFFQSHCVVQENTFNRNG